MIDFGILWRAITRFRPKPLRLQQLWLLGLPLLLVGCGSSAVAPSSTKADLKPTSKPSPDLEPAPPATPPAALTPLPSAADVQNSVSRGRIDPFAPVGGVIAGPPSGASGGQTSGGDSSQTTLTVQGVMSVGGQSRALVRTASGTGAICLGQAGRCPEAPSPPLLPKDWSVLAIDLRRGCLTYAIGHRPQKPVCLEGPKAKA